MKIVVQKFGGTSVGDIAKIRNVAFKVREEYLKGSKVIVVVSAMAGQTNKLVSYCYEILQNFTSVNSSEYDAVLASGENVTAALLALTLQSIGLQSRSLQAWQVPIITNHNHSNALIKNIPEDFLKHLLAQEIIPVITGFQGVNEEKALTTLGRGGSDTTGAAIAAAVGASRCDIYTDVDGVYTTDPRIVQEAQKISYITYEQMLEFAESGAKVLHPRAIQIAMRYKLKLRVLSSFNIGEGTTIQADENIMESSKVTGITYNRNIALVKITDIPLQEGLGAKILQKLSEENFIIDNFSFIENDLTACVVLVVNLLDCERIKATMESLLPQGYKSFNINTNIEALSLVGYSLKSDLSIKAKVFAIASTCNTKVHSISGSELKLSLIIEGERIDNLMKELHKEFILYQNPF